MIGSPMYKKRPNASNEWSTYWPSLQLGSGVMDTVGTHVG